jgi:2-aminophenol/2-amino-5-chlorophenol 1,6-dioxygenase subunit alpha
MSQGTIVSAYIVPGLPHLTSDKSAESWDKLRRAFHEAGQHVKSARPDVLVMYSTQWISVLGHLLQADPNPKGLHVDDNWYEYGDFPFDFRCDVQLDTRATELANSMGLSAHTVNYRGFPIDTGSLVTLRFLNPDNAIPVSLVSCNIYAGQEDSLKLGKAMQQSILESGKRAVVVAVTGMSARFFTEEINPLTDRFSKEEDDGWNRRILKLIEQGKNNDVLALSADYAQAAAPDMAFKAFAWLMGVLGTPSAAGKVLGYGPVWGTGAAVVEYNLAA